MDLFYKWGDKLVFKIEKYVFIESFFHTWKKKLGLLYKFKNYLCCPQKRTISQQKLGSKNNKITKQPSKYNIHVEWREK